jgi:hypothetical protein
MYEEKSHLVPAPADDPLLQKLVEGEGVESETNDEQDRVGDDRNDLCRAKLHVLW